MTERDDGTKVVIEPLDTTRTAEYALPDRQRIVFQPGSTFISIGSSSWQVAPDNRVVQNTGPSLVIDLNSVLGGKLRNYSAASARLEGPLACEAALCYRISATWDTILRPPTRNSGVMLVDAHSYRLVSVTEVETYPDGQKIDRTSTFFDHAVPVTIIPPSQ